MKQTIQLVLLGIVLISCNSKPKSELINSKNIEIDGKDFIYEEVLISKEDVQISARIMRPAFDTLEQAAILFHSIYAMDRDTVILERAAKQGYISVLSYSRGKVKSNNEITPYEMEMEDVNIVIDWVSNQSWNNGSVGMYGGSYSGFAQWAATKNLHPALKTIVPSVSAAPGLAEPMENGVFTNFLYPWPLYVSTNKFVNDSIYSDRNRYPGLYFNWFEKGVAFNKLDSLDGLDNVFFQKWLKHPSYDSYWQNMIPQGEEYSKINIPVLSTTGYYDGGQNGALHYLKEHYKYNPSAEHYLLIGPYDHFGAQGKPSANISGYEIDEKANIDIRAIIFDWFDYVLKKESKPTILKDKINYEIMGANKWNSVSDLSKIANDTIKFYLSNEASDLNAPFDIGNSGNQFHFSMSTTFPSKPDYLEQKVDFSDRASQNNYFTPFILTDTLTVGNGFSFVTAPFQESFELNGAYTGSLTVQINKRDFDFSTMLYEYTKDGKFFKLTLRNIARASLSNDISKRELLESGEKETIPFENVRMTSKRIEKGSRLVLVLNANKHPFEQLNYGTGRDVSTESLKDASEPLIIQWFNNSYIEVPIFK